MPDTVSVLGLLLSAVCLAVNPRLPVGFPGTVSPATVVEAVVRAGGHPWGNAPWCCLSSVCLGLPMGNGVSGVAPRSVTSFLSSVTHGQGASYFPHLGLSVFLCEIRVFSHS